MRILLELSYEAIIDAGMCLETLKDINVGVFFVCDLLKFRGSKNGKENSFGSSLVSHYLNLNGPSITLYTDSSNSIIAFDCAYHYLKSGTCDSAIVSAFNDVAVCAFFLQKIKDSKRIYAQISHSILQAENPRIENEKSKGFDENFYLKNNSKSENLNFKIINENNNKVKKIVIDDQFSNLIQIAQTINNFESEEFMLNLNPSNNILEQNYKVKNSNCIMTFKQNPKIKNNQNDSQDTNTERMILWSGRSKSSIISIFDDISSRPLDFEHISLLQNSQAVCIDYDIKYFDGIPRKIVFVFGGMGTQWHRMRRDLMKIQLFSDSIEKSHEILLQKGINLKGILNSTNKNVCENVLTSCIAIVTIEIALTDVFEALGVKFDFIIGHSVGKIACAYADKCLTREEALTAVYLRAKLTIDSKIHGGSLAVVGVHYSKLTDLPPEIDIACINSNNSTTISGPKEFMIEYIVELKVQKFLSMKLQVL